MRIAVKKMLKRMCQWAEDRCRRIRIWCDEDVFCSTKPSAECRECECWGCCPQAQKWERKVGGKAIRSRESW